MDKVASYILKRIKDTYGSLNNFSKEIGVPQSTLSSALNKNGGFGNMGLKNALKVSKALGLDVQTLEEFEFNEERPDEKRLLNIYQSVSRPGKKLIMTTAECVRDYEEDYKSEFGPEEPLMAASGGENASEEEFEEAGRIARRLRRSSGHLPD